MLIDLTGEFLYCTSGAVQKFVFSHTKEPVVNLFKLFGILAISVADEYVKEILGTQDKNSFPDEPSTYGDAGDLGRGYHPADQVERMRRERARTR